MISLLLKWEYYFRCQRLLQRWTKMIAIEHSALCLVHSECSINGGSKPVTPVAFISLSFNCYIHTNQPKSYLEFKPKNGHSKHSEHTLISSWMTWSSNLGKCQLLVFPQQITSCLVATVQPRAGFPGTSCGTAMNTTPQREHKNTIASPTYTQTSKHSLAPEEEMRTSHSMLCLPQSYRKGYFDMQIQKSYILPFFYHLSNSLSGLFY